MKPSKKRERRPKGEKILRPVRPSVGIEIAYRKKLTSILEEMHRSVLYWITARYRANEPRIAQDESPADALRREMADLSKRWNKRFDEMAGKLADYFATAVSQRSDGQLKRILKDGGFAIEWKTSPAVRDVIKASVHENVGLIKSIPQQHLSKVEGLVMRSVQTGRDLEQLTKDLEKQFGVTRRRAAFIAKDQNNKATAAITRARQIEAGITEAVWVHSGGGHHPRETHLKAGRDKVRYNVREGWFDPDVGEHIFPGSLPNCRCVCRPVVKGFS